MLMLGMSGLGRAMGNESAVNLFIYPFSLFLSMLNVEKEGRGRKIPRHGYPFSSLIILR
jgi:hypothetical protein